MTTADLFSHLRPGAATPVAEEVTRLSLSSRDVEPGAVFFALRGAKVDGHEFICQAIEKGAVAIVAERSRPSGCSIPWLKVDDSRAALAKAAAKFYGDPSLALKVAGITGTNGKTTTAFLLQHLIKAALHRCGMLGTVHYDLGLEIRLASHTTPESLDAHRLLKEMADAGCKGAVMEVSSHALAQSRVGAVEFDAAVFTNLTQDHLDFHGTMEEYFEAKARFGEHLASQKHKTKPVFIINRDDSYGQRLIRRFEDRLSIVTYGLGVGADYRAVQARSTFQGTTYQLEMKDRSLLTRLPLIGRHNVYNSLAALAAAKALKLNLREAVKHLAEAPQVPGRLEDIANTGSFKVYVDYAHTPDALENAILTLRQLDPRGVITVFGCGGDRDPLKRPIMGRVAAQHSDFCFVTSDNPRSEDPMEIIDGITSGMGAARYQVEPDRRAAIRAAVAMAEPRDIVLIAGKGHETYQQFADQTVHFDDREEAAGAIRLRDLQTKGMRGGRP